MAFKYAKYKEDDDVKKYGANAAKYETAADKALNRLQKGTSLQGDVNDARNAVLNQGPFTYNMADDGLYDQYKGQYTALGKQAMQDTVAKAADLTGGYGNSYGVTAGNQAYQGYLQQLNDMTPQLYAIAQDRYNAETQQLMNNYSMLADQEANEYARMQNELSALQGMAQYNAGRYDTLANMDYTKWADARAAAYTQYRDEIGDTQYKEQFAYQKGRDEVADDQWAKEYALNQTAASKSGSGSGKSNAWTIDDTKTMEEIINSYFALDSNGRLTSEESNDQLYYLLKQFIPEDNPLFDSLYQKYRFGASPGVNPKGFSNAIDALLYLKSN